MALSIGLASNLKQDWKEHSLQFRDAARPGLALGLVMTPVLIRMSARFKSGKADAVSGSSYNGGFLVPKPVVTSIADERRGLLQRRRLLTAATECFRKYGFHNATIALISEAAGMSVGQIYHYFSNKEAIITACVEEQVAGIYAQYDEFERAAAVTEAIVEGAPVGLEPRVDSDLMMEVLAEASRNPAVAQLVDNIDQRLRERIRQLISRSDAERGQLDFPDLDLRVEALLALQIGMSIRLSLNPKVDRENLKRLLRRPLRAILEG